MIESAQKLLIDLGARDIEHPGGTLHAHLHRVHDLLGSWGARPALQLAGLCHAFYGTDGFAQSLLDLSERSRLVAAIGVEAEELVYFYASCERSYSYAHLTDGAAQFKDRFTGSVLSPSLGARQDLVELTVANELDLVRVNEEIRDKYGAALLRLFTRLRPLMSEPAWRACQTTLRPKDTSRAGKGPMDPRPADDGGPGLA